MKKSEMIKVIQDYLDFHGHSDVSAPWILKKIEDAGMEPPKIKAESLFHGAVDEYGMTNEWEDE